MDRDFRYVRCNPALAGIDGARAEDLISRRVPDVVPALWPQLEPVYRKVLEQRKAVTNLVVSGETSALPGQVRHWLCNYYPVQLNDKVIGIGIIVSEVTEQRQLEEQLRQSQKMEAIGRLAGGVAHDFNNVLTIINGYSDILVSLFPPKDSRTELLRQIRKAGERAAGLTRQLLAFSRKDIAAPTLLSLNEIVRNIEKMLGRLLGEDIEVRTDLQPDLGLIRADPCQMEQVLFNLAANARDAMPQGGRLTIETRRATLDALELLGQSDTDTRPGVLLVVKDTGCGMDEATRSRIFEPFFTTKDVGKGTGLGLATVHGIIKQSGGHITFASEPGVGTTFRIFLPGAESVAPHGTPLPVVAKPTKGSETVLLVEDEEGVRTLSRMVLEEGGYTVLEASSGAEALRICEQRKDPIHLLLTDVVLPGMGGSQVAETCRSLHPEMRILYMSGYTDDTILRHGILTENVDFLHKPFLPASFTHKIREVLDRAR